MTAIDSRASAPTRRPRASTNDVGSLDKLLRMARRATPFEMIRYRNPLAEHGAAAIDALKPWLPEPAFRAFAIRTIARAGQQGSREEAISALRMVPADAPPHILRDVDEALASLGSRRAGTRPRSAASAPVAIDDRLYTFLVTAAGNGQRVSYTEAGEVVGLSMRSPNHRRVLGQMLGVISENEALHGRPMLSSIVVHKGSKKLGQGFYDLGEQLRHKSVGEDEAGFAERETLKTFEYWGGSVVGRLGRTATGAPDYRSRAPREDPPEALGACDFTGATGQCQNPGRWDRDGLLSCTTHALAASPTPWKGR